MWIRRRRPRSPPPSSVASSDGNLPIQIEQEASSLPVAGVYPNPPTPTPESPPKALHYDIPFPMVPNHDTYPNAWYIFLETINLFLQNGQPTINLDPVVNEEPNNTIHPNIVPKDTEGTRGKNADDQQTPADLFANEMGRENRDAVITWPYYRIPSLSEGEPALKKRKLEHKGYENIDWKSYEQVGQEDVCAHHSGKLKTRSLKSIMNQINPGQHGH